MTSHSATATIVVDVILVYLVVSALPASDYPPDDLAQWQLIAPPTINNGPPSHVIYNIGDRVVLPCSAAGVPQPTYEWHRNGQPLTTSNASNAEYYVRDLATDGTLYVKTQHGQGHGYYQCRAVNTAGVAISNVTYLQEAVFDDVDHWARGTVLNITVKEGRHVVLRCNHYVSIPSATVTWYSTPTDFRRTEGNQPQAWRKVLASERIAFDDTGNLLISNVVPADALTYKCQAYNYVVRQASGGSYYNVDVDTALYKLSHRVPELIYASAPMASLAGSDVALICLFASTPTPEIKWSRINGDLPTSATSYDFDRRLLLKSTTPGDAGLYQCTANNSVAQASAVISLTVNSLPSLVEPLQSQTVDFADSAFFSCLGQGRPSPAYTWYINGRALHESISVNMQWSVHNGGSRLRIYDVRLTPGFTVTCNVSNIYGHVLSASYVIVRTSSPSKNNEALNETSDLFVGGGATATMPDIAANYTTTDFVDVTSDLSDTTTAVTTVADNDCNDRQLFWTKRCAILTSTPFPVAGPEMTSLAVTEEPEFTSEMRTVIEVSSSPYATRTLLKNFSSAQQAEVADDVSVTSYNPAHATDNHLLNFEKYVPQELTSDEELTNWLDMPLNHSIPSQLTTFTTFASFSADEEVDDVMAASEAALVGAQSQSGSTDQQPVVPSRLLMFSLLIVTCCATFLVVSLTIYGCQRFRHGHTTYRVQDLEMRHGRSSDEQQPAGLRYIESNVLLTNDAQHADDLYVVRLLDNGEECHL